MATINPDGTGLKKIATGHSGNNWVYYHDPQWSPTGAYLIYGSGGSSFYGRFDVYRATASGGSKTNLTPELDTVPDSTSAAFPEGWR